MENSKNNESWFSIAGIWFGCIASLPALLIGSTLINYMTLFETVIIAFFGYSFVLLFLSLLSVKAVRFRFNAVELAQSSFGETGAKVIVGLIIGIASMVWFGVQTNIAGVSFTKVMHEAFDIQISVGVSSLLWGIIMVLTAVFGFKYVKWLNYIAVPGILILIIYSLYITLQGVSFEQIINHVPEQKMTLLKGIGIVVGLIAVGGVISPDYNRFAKTPKTAVLGSVVGMLPAAVAFLTIGAILAVIKGTHDIVAIFAKIGYPVMAMSILILVTWTSNVMSAYSGGLGLNGTFHLSEKYRPYTTLIVGLTGTILGVMGILDKFVQVAEVLSAMIPPVAGVIISDYYFRSNKIKQKYKPFNWTGIISWLSGVSVVFILVSDIKNILGIIISVIMYRTLYSFNRKKSILL